MKITTRDLKRLADIEAFDLANWKKADLIKLPPSRKGSERVFRAADREILLRLAFMKTLINVGFSAGDASIVAKGWADKALKGDLRPFFACNPRRPETSRLEYTKSISVAAFFETDAFPDHVGGDHIEGTKSVSPILPASAIVIVNRAEIVGRIDAALGRPAADSETISPAIGQ
jgi:DNA-binding transcriptional MerR regulator